MTEELARLLRMHWVRKSVINLRGRKFRPTPYSPFPSDIYGFVKTDWEKYIKRDSAKAKKLLAEAGYPNGLR